MMTSEENPILEAFRGNVEKRDTELGEESFDDVLYHWVWYLSEGMQEVSWEYQDYWHAWQVIGRLANLRGLR